MRLKWYYFFKMSLFQKKGIFNNVGGGGKISRRLPGVLLEKVFIRETEFVSVVFLDASANYAFQNLPLQRKCELVV